MPCWDVLNSKISSTFDFSNFAVIIEYVFFTRDIFNDYKLIFYDGFQVLGGSQRIGKYRSENDHVSVIISSQLCFGYESPALQELGLLYPGIDGIDLLVLPG